MLTDELINNWIGAVFGTSEPGSTLHHMITAVASPIDCSPLGVVNPDKLKIHMYAIAPDNSVDPIKFISKTIAAAIVETRRAESVIAFCALATEFLTVTTPVDDPDARARNRQMVRENKLQEHPDVAETTLLYAAARDGRRWIGQHHLTGPMAGTVSGPTLRDGDVGDDEKGTHRQLVRAAVGLAPMPHPSRFM